jgi:zinc transporter ZupT
MVTGIALGLGALIGGAHFFGEKLKIDRNTKPYRIISFAAGISIAYLFLDLLPHVYEAASILKNGVFIFLLLGFATVHLVEKYIYQHADVQKLTKELKAVHAVTFFLYYFMIGIVLKGKIQADILESVLFIIPVTLHAGLSTSSLSEIHGMIKENIIIRVLLSSAPLFGILFARAILIPEVAENIMVSLIAGILLYVMVKEFLPEKKKGQPAFFIVGLILFTVFQYLLSFLFK